MNEKEIINIVDNRIQAAIDIRKKEVAKQFKIWGGAISTIFSVLLFLGFTTDDFIKKARNKLIPTSHIVDNLIKGDEESRKLKTDILDELSDPSFKDYPEVKESLAKNVWLAMQTDDKDKIHKFLNNTKLDEEIIETYYEQVIDILFSERISDKKKRIDTIMKAGSIKTEALIGEYENRTGSDTNCGMEFNQDLKRAIIHIPGLDPDSGEVRDKQPVPWFQCPRGYPQLTISLDIEDIVVDGIKLVGVERPTESKDVVGIRVRVTNAVANEFLNKGIKLGNGIKPGFVYVTAAK